MVGMFEDEQEYLFAEQRDRVKFLIERVQSQLKSVRKREKMLTEDMITYFIFFLLPIIVFCISFLLTIFGNIGLRLITIPALVVCAVAFMLLCPVSAYKFSMAVILFILNRQAGSVYLFGKVHTLYTYKQEESYCIAKLQKLQDYLKQIDEWDLRHADGEEIPDLESIQNYLDAMDLDIDIPVALMKDPFTKRIGFLGIPLMYAGALIVVLLIWLANGIGISQAYEWAGNLWE